MDESKISKFHLLLVACLLLLLLLLMMKVKSWLSYVGHIRRCLGVGCWRCWSLKMRKQFEHLFAPTPIETVTAEIGGRRGWLGPTIYKARRNN